ncbi:MAG: aminomethyl-transferring glycine dehydrogenase subunit GcvPB [Acidobacteria bacterium]|nr:aminomethyl-transferring glycine dehydrogenase subunit GcvPB [Acidobacteriota bacterium]MBI3658378.1 aminomethyl-transferring glycine dehydrogenase subunit GcvPB [Acidobacteriota bacterium]
MSRKRHPVPTITISEPLIFEKSAPGRVGCTLPPLDVPAQEISSLVGSKNLRLEIAEFPEVSEFDVVQHFTRLSTYNYHIDLGLFPLGSCTMKYNPKLNEAVARYDGLSRSHPLQPDSVSQGCLEVLKMLERCLLEILGMDAITLQPAAGAHGELTGILLARAYHSAHGRARKFILIPDSAHGTNPATAVIAGYTTQTLKSNDKGCIDLKALQAAMTEDVACLMLTNPNTLGIFEENIIEIAEVVHSKDGLLYMDGANMNALLGVARPGDFGIDIVHMNLHKTMSTPHGGGGPGGGPVGVKKILEPYLPVPRLERADAGKLRLNYDCPQAIGRVRAFHGNFGVSVRALCYILTCGRDGLKKLSEHAVLNANYIRYRLQEAYDLPYRQPTLHEVIFSDKQQAKNDVHTIDIAKRLMDYGFHPPTTYFPLIVSGALMIEPTESPDREELDAFVEAMLAIAEEAKTNPNLVREAPHITRSLRFDEVTAARKPVLRWTGA